MERDPSEAFFSPDQGGDPAMFQHVFWYFGHPEVYLPLVIIALGLCVLTFAKFFPAKWKAIIRAMKWPPSVPSLWIYGGVFIAVVGGICFATVEMKSLNQFVKDDISNRMFFRLFLNAIVMNCIAAIVFAALPRLLRSMYNRRLAWIIWGLWNFGMYMILVPEYFILKISQPRHYVDYPASYIVLDFISAIGLVLCALALATFVILVIEALVKRRPLRDKPVNPTLDVFE